LGINGLGAATLFGFIATAIAFFKAYGPYLDRLVKWAPPRVSTIAEASPIYRGDDSSRETDNDKAATFQSLTNSVAERSPNLAEPVSTDTIVALSMSVYGLLFLVGGLIWSRGEQLTYNAIAGAGFIVVAAIAWWFGHRSAC
jgi:hypothetical protein